MSVRGRLFLLLAGAFLLAAPVSAQLTSADVQRVIEQAVRRADRIAPNSVIAVTNREGYVLGVWVVRGGEPTALEVATSVGKAGTASFLSSNTNAFTSRTAGFIIQQHFPPGVRNLPPGPLVGVGFSNLPFSDVNRFKKADFIPGSASPGTFGSPIPLTSLNGIPGGLPLYKNNILVGGIGVTGSGIEFPPTAFVGDYSKDEDIALAGQAGFTPSPQIFASDVFINGISLPYVGSSTGSLAGSSVTGNAAAMYPVIASPAPFPYPLATFATVNGQVRQPIMADPMPGTINGQPRLTAAEVTGIITLAADRVRTTRAGIRLPVGQRMEAFITVVNNPNTPGVGPKVLGTFRTGDATLFSWDVAVQKARTVIVFSSRTTAFSTRTVGFLTQRNYPPGIDPESPGPFNGLQEEVSGFDRAALPALVPTAALLSDPPFPPNPMLPNGLTIFPGGFPLYRNGELVGAIGISGDGVDQDDIVGASGTSNFLPPDGIRADQFDFRGTRLPYAKFPRDPEGGPGIVPVVMPIIAGLALPTDALANISTRVEVGPGDGLMISGFIISGGGPKRVVLRGIGPSVADHGVANPLADPVIRLFQADGAVLAANDRWQDHQQAEILATGLAPARADEAALVQTLAPGAYTASLTSATGGTGIGLLEVYDVDPLSAARLINISSRGFVGAGDRVMIGGFILRGAGGRQRVLVRALGPSLARHGVAGVLADPTLEVRDANGVLLAANNDWRDTQAGGISASTLAPEESQESAAMLSLTPGAYTATLRGVDGSAGVGLLEVYRLD